mmetsp:Transcript_61333/g.168357  ORF Transcript_61333/g.168357 Transcript_61333/m.168357 type:complete len:235 (-) Transcript_61333:365-1069(-)
MTSRARIRGSRVSSPDLEYNTEPAQMQRWLKISDPMMVPMPREVCVMKSETNAANISGELAPAAMKVAPATSSGMLSLSQSTLRAGTKYSSTTTARAQNDVSMSTKYSAQPPSAVNGSTSSASSSPTSVQSFSAQSSFLPAAAWNATRRQSWGVEREGGGRAREGEGLASMYGGPVLRGTGWAKQCGAAPASLKQHPPRSVYGSRSDATRCVAAPGALELPASTGLATGLAPPP